MQQKNNLWKSDEFLNKINIISNLVALEHLKGGWVSGLKI